MFPGTGTIVNVVTIIIGGLIGLFAGKLIPSRMQDSMIKTLGIATFLMSVGSCLSKMIIVNITTSTAGDISASLDTQGIMMMIISLVIGTFIGEAINIEMWLERFGEWLKVKSKSTDDNSFINAFITASFTAAIGAMAVMGGIQDGMGDPYTLFAKSLLDFMLVLMLTASMGKGCIFCAIPVGVLQGSFVLLSRLLVPIMTEMAVNNLSLVGNALITCVGINLIFPKTIRVANLLPAIVIAVLFAFL